MKDTKSGHKPTEAWESPFLANPMLVLGPSVHSGVLGALFAEVVPNSLSPA